MVFSYLSFYSNNLMFQQRKNDKEYDQFMNNTKNIFKFSIVGAGSNKAIHMIIYALLRLKGIKMKVNRPLAPSNKKIIKNH